MTCLPGAFMAQAGMFADCTQADVDAWSVEHANSNRINVRAFLHWSARTRLTRRFELPAALSPGNAPMPDRQCTALLGQVLADDTTPLRSRVAAVILLLYAQPLSRITQFTIDDVVRDGDGVLLRLGDPPSPAPEPGATLLLEYLGQRTNMATATNRESRWLFPPAVAPASHFAPTHCPRWSTPSASPRPPDAPRTYSTCPPRSSPPHSATTRSPRPVSPPRRHHLAQLRPR